LDTRAKEKTEMNVLNERFASYIEKVRFVEAQNKALLAEIDRLKKQKSFDASEIKELYEQEISDSRKIIDDLSDEKAKFDATLVSAQDKLEDEARE
jgi:intermediate filament protein if